MDSKVLERFWEKVDKSDDCWLWTSATLPSGYGLFSKNGKTEYAHRMSWVIANGQIPDGVLICHTCDNPGCVNPDHLFPGTYSDNSSDMIAKGRQRGQAAIPGDDEAVIAVRHLYGEGYLNLIEVAEACGVRYAQAAAYVHGRTKNFASKVRPPRVAINGQALRDARLMAGLCQREMEDNLGLGQGAISRFEHERNPRLSYLWLARRLAEYLGVSVDSITYSASKTSTAPVVATGAVQAKERRKEMIDTLAQFARVSSLRLMNREAYWEAVHLASVLTTEELKEWLDDLQILLDRAKEIEDE